jgi:hypothetical protein
MAAPRLALLGGLVAAVAAAVALAGATTRGLLARIDRVVDGDTVELKNNEVFVNDKKLERDRLPPSMSHRRPPTDLRTCPVNRH